MNRLEDYFYNKAEKIIDKWHHYFEIYDKHFSKFVDKSPKVLEIGVQKGGSLLMWKDYFGENSTIVGIDIDNNCKVHENIEENMFVHIFDQSNEEHLNNLIEIYKNFDVIIDDGSHINDHMQFTFKKMFENLNYGGVYLIEDVHTSYWPNWGGCLKCENSIIEFSKDIVDSVNGYHHGNIDYYTKNIDCVSHYDSVIVFDKKIHDEPPISTTRYKGNRINFHTLEILE